MTVISNGWNILYGYQMECMTNTSMFIIESRDCFVDVMP